MNDKVVLEVRGIVKDFPGLRANDNISFQLHEGEILTLLGENGAGKTTLMNIIMGIYKPDAGEILVNGEPVHISDPREANRLGIGMVHQHFKLVHNFTVAENIVLGAEPGNGLKLNMKQAVRRVQELSERYGLAIDPNARTDKITVGMQQRTEILKMLYRDANILIFDEPTAVLMPQEIEDLIAIMRSLVARGKSIILITHKLKEIEQVADRCVIIRRGQLVDTVNVADTTTQEMADKMVGRVVHFNIDKQPQTPGKCVLKVEHLSVKNEQNVLRSTISASTSMPVRSSASPVSTATARPNWSTPLPASARSQTAKSPSAVRTSRMRPSASGSLPEFPISRKTGSGAVWCWISRWRKTSSLDAAARSRFPPTAS